MSDIITFEKQIEEFLRDNTEEFTEKKFSGKTVFKYFVFTLVLAGTLAMVFNLIYTDVSSSTGNTVIKTFNAATAIGHLQNAGPGLAIGVGKVASMFLSAWAKKRMFMIMHEKISMKHLVISSIMGSIIAFITPFAIGGDAIGYWYLRRKGVKRAPLIASLSSSTLISEAKFALQTIFLLGVGWPIYSHIFNASSPEAFGAMIGFMAGLSGSVFSTFMIFVVILSRRFQEFIIKYGILFLEGFPFTHLYDPGRRVADLQYEFANIRSGVKTIGTKGYFPFELIFYSMIPLFFQPAAIIYATSGLIRDDMGVNPYGSLIVTNDIIGTSNSMSFLPGGSGTGEGLSKTFNAQIFTNKAFPSKPNVETLATGADLFGKFFMTGPWLVFSAFLSVFTVVQESAKAKTKLKIRVFKIASLLGLTLVYLIFYFILYSN